MRGQSKRSPWSGRGAAFEFPAQAVDHADKVRPVGVVCGERFQFGDKVIQDTLLGPCSKHHNRAGSGYVFALE
jgi:hypothetical protein